MKKIILVSMVFLLFQAVYGMYTTPTDPPYYVGQTINFKSSNYWLDIYSSDIDFGDGTVLTSLSNMYTTGVDHVFTQPGTYHVQLTSSFQPTEDLYITVGANKYITLTPNPPHAGETVTFTANEFNYPKNIYWDFGDGTVITSGSRRSRIKGVSTVTHIYTSEGSYLIKAYDGGDPNTTPVTKRITVLQAQRAINYSPNNPIEDQKVYFTASGFTTSQIDWNFGDGTILTQADPNQTHRFQTQGTYAVSAKDSTVNHTPVTTSVTVLPDNRFLEVSSPETMPNEPVVFYAYNFVGELILWDFGDGTVMSAGAQVEHMYARGGTYTVRAVDENGESSKVFEATVKVIGVTDEINLEVAEIRFDNGKYYKVVSKNSKDLKAVLRMKLRGTGVVTGYWILDGNPFEFINDVSIQGELKEIYTKDIPGLPTIEPGIHTVSLKLTRPSSELTFPTLKYYVLPYENRVEVISPPDGFVAKEKEIPVFSWKEPAGGVKYKIAFANYLYKFIYSQDKINWIDTGLTRKFQPGKELWNGINRNKWSYWKVRAYDSNNNVIAESDINELKVVIATAEISINTVEDIDGKKIVMSKNGVNSASEAVIVKGSVKYKGNSKYLILRVYLDDMMTDQLLFRDVKKGEIRNFETSIPNNGKGKVVFRVLKTSSPSVVIGIRGLNLIKKK